jgi:hypothetical protein
VNALTPLSVPRNVYFAGRTACLSVLVNVAVPRYPVATLPDGSITALGQRAILHDPSLVDVINAWDRLPEAIRAGIVAMVTAAKTCVLPSRSRRLLPIEIG